MASKMQSARDGTNNPVTIAMAELQEFAEPLKCEFCDASVGFVNAFTRHVGEDIIAVQPYFRLKKGNKHSLQCRYEVHGQVTIIANESESDIFEALKGNRYRLRLLAVKNTIETLREQAEAKKKLTPADTDDSGTTTKNYLKGEKLLGAYINSAMRVLKVRAACEEHSEIEDVLELAFNGVLLPWRDFYFEDSEYFRCFAQVDQATVQVPIAIRGTIKSSRIVKGRTDEFAVLNLVRPHRKTDQPDTLDAACFSIWSPDLSAFGKFKEGEQIIAFGLWVSRGVLESQNKDAEASIRKFRNHELRLWPVTKSQLCSIRN